MKRDYELDTNTDSVTMFTGIEIEHTPAHGMQTLFVVGTDHTVEDIMENVAKYNCTHVYLGANMSYDDSNSDEWDTLVFGLLKDRTVWVTLDFESKYTEWVLESGYTEYNKFIPMVSVRLPYARQLGYNACIKIDDKDFNATNEGVWVHSLHNLMDRSVFTDWGQYTQDHIIK